MMNTAFVSHSSQDKNFVDLLIHVLDFHHIQTWYDSHDIEHGKKFIEEIQNGIEKADCLIVVISKNSLNSKWIVREISSFLTSKPDAKMLPIVIEKVKINELFEGLEAYQAILFYENMLDGFNELLNVFGKEFLPVAERREAIDRRSDERREFYDRRKSSIIMRLRKGFWKCYSRDNTDIGPFDNFNLLPSKRVEVMNSLKSELEKYEYFDADENQIEFTPQELDRITYEVWEDMSAHNYVTAISVIENIAEKVLINFSKIELSFRRSEKRREHKDRREDK